MEWKECPGIGKPAMRSESKEYGRWCRAICPVCTKYVDVRIGAPTPHHLAVVIVSAPRITYPLPDWEFRL